MTKIKRPKKKKRKTNNDLKNITQKTTRTPQKHYTENLRLSNTYSTKTLHRKPKIEQHVLHKNITQKT